MSAPVVRHFLLSLGAQYDWNEPLAPYTYLKVGGPAEFLVQPRSRDELSAVVQHCFQKRLPLRCGQLM